MQNELSSMDKKTTIDAIQTSRPTLNDFIIFWAHIICTWDQIK